MSFTLGDHVILSVGTPFGMTCVEPGPALVRSHFTTQQDKFAKTKFALQLWTNCVTSNKLEPLKLLVVNN
jgi:hypothetical protein